MSKKESALPKTKPRKKEEWTTADEASWESFPASDPPAYGKKIVKDSPARRKKLNK